MLIHPPIVFLGYSDWAIPFALAVAALMRGESTADWIHIARSWSLFGWAVLGSGILIGAHWAYGELGWGGYWGWDPVENGSLIPWLVGTTSIHTQMAWRHRRILKRSALATTITTFAMCNFATFLTRSGIFSSVHAFSQSPIGWLFLGLMAVIVGGGGLLIMVRRHRLRAERRVARLASREAMVIVTTAALAVLALVVGAGTLSAAVSDALIGRKVVVGVSFYNRALIVSGFLVLLLMAAAPLVRWGRAPSQQQLRCLVAAAVAGGLAAFGSTTLGVREPVCQAVNGLAVFALSALAAALWLDARRLQRRLALPPASVRRRTAVVGWWAALQPLRRQYAGFVIHLGVASLAVGVAASSLGTERYEAVMRAGESLQWNGRQVTFVELAERQLPDKLLVEARLEVRDRTGRLASLAPAQHFHFRQQEWTNEVSYDTTWRGDFYTILHSAEGDDGVRMTFVVNPMMRWIWLGGWIMVGGSLAAVWPNGRARASLRGRAAAVPLAAEQFKSDRDAQASGRRGAKRHAA
jgi:cytochrome c-type biogenesis protein CcmF